MGYDGSGEYVVLKVIIKDYFGGKKMKLKNIKMNIYAWIKALKVDHK